MCKSLILFLFIAQLSHASIQVWPLGAGARFERDENQSLTPRVTQRIAVGLNIESIQAEIASDQFSSKSSEGNVSIKRSYQDFTLWLGHQFHQWDHLNFYAMGGLGQYQETIKTRVGTLTDESTSNSKTLMGVGLELRYKPFDIGLLVSSGARILWAENFDPNLQPDLFVRLGFEF